MYLISKELFFKTPEIKLSIQHYEGIESVRMFHRCPDSDHTIDGILADSEVIRWVEGMLNSQQLSCSKVATLLMVSTKRLRETLEATGYIIPDQSIWTQSSGEDNTAAKLTDREVEEIRELYREGDHSMRHLGHIYGIDKEWVRLIVNYKERV